MFNLAEEKRKQLLKGFADNDIEKGGEGSKGGVIIGHTQSGKAIYENHNHSSHAKFSAQDHLDASNAHADLNNKKSTLTHSKSDEASAHHYRQHEKMSNDEKEKPESDEVLNAKEKFRRAKRAYNVALGNKDDAAAKKAKTAMEEFHAIFSKAEEDELEKARAGVYANTPENQKLQRVGQKYGSEKKDDGNGVYSDKSNSKEEQQKQHPGGVYSDKPNNSNFFADNVKEISEGVLKRAISESKDPKMVAAAKEELKRRKDTGDKPAAGKETSSKTPNQAGKTLADHAKEASEAALRKTIASSKDPELRVAAHDELKRREKDEAKVEDKPKAGEKKVEKPQNKR